MTHDACIKTKYWGSVDVGEDVGGEGEVVWDVSLNRHYGLTAWRRAVTGQVYVLEEKDIVQRWGAEFGSELISVLSKGEVVVSPSELRRAA